MKTLSINRGGDKKLPIFGLQTRGSNGKKRKRKEKKRRKEKPSQGMDSLTFVWKLWILA